MKYKNVAIKLLSDEIKICSKHNLAKSKSLMEMLYGAVSEQPFDHNSTFMTFAS